MLNVSGRYFCIAQEKNIGFGSLVKFERQHCENIQSLTTRTFLVFYPDP